MSAETVDDDTHEWIPWQFDRRAMIHRAGPPVYAERQAELCRRLRVVQAGAVPKPKLSPGDAAYRRDYTREEMNEGRVAVERHRKGRGPEPTPAERAAYLALHRQGRGRTRSGSKAAGEILAFVDEGMSLAEIARERGMKEESVLSCLTKAGYRDVSAKLRGVPPKDRGAR